LIVVNIGTPLTPEDNIDSVISVVRSGGAVGRISAGRTSTFQDGPGRHSDPAGSGRLCRSRISTRFNGIYSDWVRTSGSGLLAAALSAYSLSPEEDYFRWRLVPFQARPHLPRVDTNGRQQRHAIFRSSHSSVHSPADGASRWMLLMLQKDLGDP
jgi:hypothetical protein